MTNLQLILYVYVTLMSFLKAYKHGELFEVRQMVEFGNNQCVIFSRRHLLEAKGGLPTVFLEDSHMVHLGTYTKEVHSK